MRTIAVLFLALLSAVAVLMFPTISNAEQWDKETVVNFTNPVEVPGRVLAPGTYVFKLVDSQADRQLVQILTEDQQQVLTTVQAVPAYRTEPVDKPVFSVAGRPAGGPGILQSWFYPGDNQGVQFIYSKPAVVARATRVEPELASKLEPPADVPALIDSYAPSEAELITPTSPVMPTLAGAEQDTKVLAENDVPQPEQSLTKLPKTAGNYALLPLLAVLLLGYGSMVLRTAQQRM
jgi:hypothetical protein